MSIDKEVMGAYRAPNLSRAILFLTISAVLFAMKPSQIDFYGIMLPSLSTVYYPFAVITLVLSIVFMIASFSNKLAKVLAELFDSAPIKFVFLGFLWMVYYVGWVKVLAAIPADRWGFAAIFWVGFLWFFAIPFALFRDETGNLLKRALKLIRFST